MITITIANQKGGVGKSTTVAMVATELALRGYRTLAVDCDPQANLTSVFLDPSTVTTSLSDVLVTKPNSPYATLPEVILTTQINELDLLPSTLSLAQFDRGTSMSVGRLRKVLREEVGHIYEFCLIDTPPNLGLLLSAALIAANHVIIPVQASAWAVSAIQDLLPVIEEAREMNEGINLLGAVCTLLDQRVNVSAQTFVWLRDMLQDKTFETIIHRTAKLEEAPIIHQPIQLYSPNSRGAENYADLTDEIIQRIGVGEKREGGKLRIVSGGETA